ncbi:hypothetical protein MUN81_08860 [Hymenobacter sp. 5317J-9]|uniref:phasin family protein n=1 Tax=Hymenobacter sp. 5317J-9 TaxID=2932250 RepID=UPI001FD6641D|nr:hypothetical protein [Hymenobacter sp. 5317J-9]UOQ99587.1 hypothetical protein MUN81_08860 [Hymenobacter sp. 5317J-9]
MEDLFKKFVNAGVGYIAQGSKTLQSTIEKLVKDNKMTQEEGKKIIDDLMKSGETKRAELEKQFQGLADRVKSTVGLGDSKSKAKPAAKKPAAKSASAAKPASSATSKQSSATAKAAGATKKAADKVSAAAGSAQKSAAAKAGAAAKPAAKKPAAKKPAAAASGTSEGQA